MADTRTGSRIERTPSGDLVVYSFCYAIDISGTVKYFKVDVFPSEMNDETDKDEAISIADAAAAAWRTKQLAPDPDPAVAIADNALTGEVTWP